MSVLPWPPPLRPSESGSRQPSLPFSIEWTCSATAEHPFDVVGDAVAVAVLEVRRVEALGDPVDAEVGVQAGERGASGTV